MAAHMRHTSFLGRGSFQLCSRNIIEYWKPETRNSLQVFKICRASFHSRQLPVWQCTFQQQRELLFQRRRQSKYFLPASSMISRFNSNITSDSTSNTVADSTGFIQPPDYIPPAPPLPDEVASATTDLVQTLNALGEPSLQSMGLGSYWPPGLVQQGLEALHAGLGLPWWSSIVIGTLIIRTLMFPIVIKAQRISINVMNHMPTIQRLQEKFTDARTRGNMMEAMDYGMELSNYLKRNNVNFLGQFMMPLFQLPVFVSVFIGLRRMAYLPVESLTTGGCLWFPDLTVAQPFYGLPLMTAVTLWLTVEAGADGMAASSQSHMMKWFLRAMPVVMLPVIVNFPTAMLVYWFTSNSFSLVQVLFLKIPSVRKFFGIPQVVKHPQTTLRKKGFTEGFKEAYENMKASQKVQERQRVDDIALRKAAQGPIVKTYSYNPKDVKGSAHADNKTSKSRNRVMAKPKS